MTDLSTFLGTGGGGVTYDVQVDASPVLVAGGGILLSQFSFPSSASFPAILTVGEVYTFTNHWSSAQTVTVFTSDHVVVGTSTWGPFGDVPMAAGETRRFAVEAGGANGTLAVVT